MSDQKNNDHESLDEFLEVDLEADQEMGDSAVVQAKLHKLRTELKEAHAKRDEYLVGWQRCKADAVNSRKEALQEADRRAERLKIGVLEDLIPVLDSFDMATGSEAWVQMPPTWKSGMEQVKSQLVDVLARNGVERFAKVGEQFNPHEHEVVKEVDDAAGEHGTIVTILRYGYKKGSLVIRPAHVVIKGDSNKT